MDEANEFLAELEKADESEIRIRYTQGRYESPNRELVEEFLRRKDLARQNELVHLAIDNAKIARESLKVSKSARNAAWVAAAAAILACAVAIFATYSYS